MHVSFRLLALLFYFYFWAVLIHCWSFAIYISRARDERERRQRERERRKIDVYIDGTCQADGQTKCRRDPPRRRDPQYEAYAQRV